MSARQPDANVPMVIRGRWSSALTQPVNLGPTGATPVAATYADDVDRTATTVAVVPIRSFVSGKNRLSPVLDATQRERLARWSANQVIAALRSFDTLVVSDDDDVLSWAVQQSCSVLSPAESGLNAAADAARRHLRSTGVARMAVVHADLVRSADLETVLRLPGRVIVPDATCEGTNVLVLPTSSIIDFAYGNGSFRRHLAACVNEESTDPLTVVRHRDLGLDLDTPSDLQHPRAAPQILEAINV
jgi:2-phospho-L-lactate guanylyltransferase